MRYPVLDKIRGAAIISMIFYHGMWDLVYIFGLKAPWYTGLPGFIWEQSICWTFILLSGFCQSFAKHSLKNGLVISAAGLLVTVVSIIFQIGVEIYYGILTFIGAAILITAVLKPILKKINPFLGIFLSFLLFFLFYDVRIGSFGFGPIEFGTVPDWLYTNSFSDITTFLGFPKSGFVSGDYFPLLPWFWLFLTGFFGGRIMEVTGKLKLLKGKDKGLLAFLGRHSLIIYLLHQPILYFIFVLFY